MLVQMKLASHICLLHLVALDSCSTASQGHPPLLCLVEVAWAANIHPLQQKYCSGIVHDTTEYNTTQQSSIFA